MVTVTEVSLHPSDSAALLKSFQFEMATIQEDFLKQSKGAYVRRQAVS